MSRILASIVFALAVAAAASAADPLPAGAVQLSPAAVKWTPGNPAMPPGTQVSVLEGDPRAKGPFTMRVKFPAGAVVAPHWHPRPERVTVLAGYALIGFGDRVDTGATGRVDAGGFYINPPKVHHFVVYPEETILQITGDGPWELNFVDKK